MKQILVFGATYCGPCQSLKTWLESGAVDNIGVTYTYVDAEAAPRALAAFRLQIGRQDFAMVFPGVAIMDNGNFQAAMDGYNQDWILSQVNPMHDTASGPNINIGPGASSDASEDVVIIEEDENFLGLEDEEWMWIGAILFILLIAFILNKVNWI